MHSHLREPVRTRALLSLTRLRKAILHAIANSRANEHDVSSRLNENMMAKVSATRNLREDLQGQLERVRDEQTRAKAQRSALSAALEAKRGPLAQARERLAVRRARPSRETVNDEVEAALAREVAHLASICQQLSDKVSGVRLDNEDGIIALRVRWRVAMALGFWIICLLACVP